MSLPRWAALLGIAALAIGVTVAALLLFLDGRSPLVQTWLRYERALGAKLSIVTPDAALARRVARLQLLLALACLAAAFGLGERDIALVVILIAGAPWLLVNQLREKRVKELEGQLDGWLTAVANALRASPSLGEAMESTLQVARPPIAFEIERSLKEISVGTPIDVALVNLSTRVGSPVFAGAVTAVLVGRTTGGDLSALLDQTAASLREAKRLEGLISSQTKQQRTELLVVSAMPVITLLALWKMDPNLIRALTDTPAGLGVTSGVACAWIAAFLLARNILKVPI